MLTEHLIFMLKLQDFGTRMTARLLAQLWVWMAAHKTSLSAAAVQHSQMPSDETLRRAELANIPDEIDVLQQRLNTALISWAPRALRRRPQRLAIDLTLLPYYGATNTAGIYRGQAKAGTKRFWAYATCAIVSHGKRLVLGLVPVTSNQQMELVLEKLLAQAARAGVQPACLLLDRGFYASHVIDWLQRHDIPFIMPMIRRGRKLTDPRGPTGTQPFFAPGKGWAEYTWTGRKNQGPTVSVRVARVGRGKRSPLVFIVHRLNRSLTWVAETYRRRFGIETSYRQMNQSLPRTTTRDARVRLPLVGIALLIRNVWVWLHWDQISQPVRGGRKLQFSKLRFAQLLQWLAQAIPRRLQPVLDIFVPRPLCTWT
jgi:putative transposase